MDEAFCLNTQNRLNLEQTATFFAGKWDTTFGTMQLEKAGVDESNHFMLKGYYISEGRPCNVSGNIDDKGRFVFTYTEIGAQGEGLFALNETKTCFSGKWREKGTSAWAVWEGTRKDKKINLDDLVFTGLWSTSYGKMRLVQDKKRVTGFYQGNPISRVFGFVEQNMEKNRPVLYLQYKEKSAQGLAVFELSDKGDTFFGKWQETSDKPFTGTTAEFVNLDTTDWQAWIGIKEKPVPGKSWLVVLEARWEDGLADKEYSYGNMLKSYFARTSAVNVRHRYFDNEKSLKKWCKEIPFLSGPVVLAIATHGLEEGIQVQSSVIGPDFLAEALAEADNIKLLHFSSCLIMKGNFYEGMINKIQKIKGRSPKWPVSGYASEVDWAMSAVLEFLYFDIILVRGYEPEAASNQILKLLPFAGDSQVKGAPFASAEFKFKKTKYIHTEN